MKMTATPSDKLPKVINWAVYFWEYQKL
jgi:hypothetical protein